MPEYVGEGKILIVEDEKVVADSLAQILSSKGYDARVVYSAEAALHLVTQWLPNLAILDVMLPRMNGIDLAVILKERFAGCHILLFSGQPTVEALMKKAKSDGHEFEIMAKPVHPTVMLEAISKRLAAKAAQPCRT
jgi:DNA-binding NtrC family response regulator